MVADERVALKKQSNGPAEITQIAFPIPPFFSGV